MTGALRWGAGGGHWEKRNLCLYFCLLLASPCHILPPSQLDNHGRRLLLSEEASLNIPAVAAAHVIKRYTAQAPDELSFEVRLWGHRFQLGSPLSLLLLSLPVLTCCSESSHVAITASIYLKLLLFIMLLCPL